MQKQLKSQEKWWRCTGPKRAERNSTKFPEVLKTRGRNEADSPDSVGVFVVAFFFPFRNNSEWMQQREKHNNKKTGEEQLKTASILLFLARVAMATN